LVNVYKLVDELDKANITITQFIVTIVPNTLITVKEAELAYKQYKLYSGIRYMKKNFVEQACD